MLVNPYGEDPLRLAVHLVNVPPAGPETLEEICLAAGVVIERPVDSQDLAQTAAMLEAWQRVVDEPAPQTRADILNALLAASATYPSLTNHNGQGWHLHYREADLSLWQILRTMVYVGTALHFATRGIHRLGRCSASSCVRIYADFSRPGTQRYCSAACANRDAVRRHRARPNPSE